MALTGVSSPDLLAMAESGLVAAVSGNWEISHDTASAVWGRAVVKGLKEGVILTSSVIPCTFGFRHGPNPQVTDVYTSAITIQWGPDDSSGNYATLESSGKDVLKWRLPLQDDGSMGSYTIWRRTNNKAAKDQATQEAMMEQAAKHAWDVRAKEADEIENFKRNAVEEVAELRSELVDLRVKAADQVSASRSQAAIEIAAAQAKVAAEIAEVRAKAAFYKELEEARGKIADEIADENESLRVQLNSQASSSDSLRDQVQSLRALIMEMMPSKASKFKDLLHEKVIFGSKTARQQEGTPDKELPLEKRRRTDNNVGKENVGNVSNDNNVLEGLALISCGA